MLQIWLGLDMPRKDEKKKGLLKGVMASKAEGTEHRKGLS